MANFSRLIVEQIEVNPGGFFRRHLRQFSLQRVANIDDVDAGNKRDAHRHRLAAVGVVDAGRGFAQPARDRRNIPQPGRRSRAMRVDRQVAQFVDIVKFPGGMQANGLAAGFYLPGAGNDVQATEKSGKLIKGNAAGRHFRQRDINVNLLGDRAADGDLADAGHQHQLPAQLLGIADQLRIAKTVAGNGKEEAKHVAEIIVDEGGNHAWREEAGRIAHPAPQLIPDLRQLIGVVIRGDVHRNLRESVGRNRADVIQIGQLLQGIFQRKGDLFFDLLRRCARIVGNDHRRFNGKGRIFQTADIEQGKNTANAQQQNS